MVSPPELSTLTQHPLIVSVPSLIAGALLAFAAAFFLFKRRSKARAGTIDYTKDHTYADSSPELVMLQKTAGRNSPYVQVSQTPLPPPIASIPPPQPPKDIVTSILPAAAHDSEIQNRVSALFGALHRHIDMFYRDAHASITPSMEHDLVRFGAGDVNMAELLQDCSSPTTAIKHALVAYVFGITGPRNGEEGETLFPDVLVGMGVGGVDATGMYSRDGDSLSKVLMKSRFEHTHCTHISPPPLRLPLHLLHPILFIAYLPPPTLRYPRSSRALQSHFLSVGEPWVG